MLVTSILKEKGGTVFTAQAAQTLMDAATILRERKIGAVIIVDARALPVGVLSERDIVRALATHGQDIMDRPIREFMTSEVITITPDMTVDQVMEVMSNNRIRHLPVMEEGRLSGIISIGDVVRVKIEAVEAEAEALKSYIAS